MRRDQVKTPALIVDVDALDRNIAIMSAWGKATGVSLRQHAKSHKSAAVAKRLAAAGALGSSCATIDEAEALAAAGLGGILITSPMAADHMLARVVKMLTRQADIIVVADHPGNVDALAAIACTSDRTLQVVVDLDVGQSRTGCIDIADAVALARRIATHRSLDFAGIQAYWGHLQQVMPFEERRRKVAEGVARVSSLLAALRASNLEARMVTGSGTGTHWLDAQQEVFTELQPGSYLFLDSCYAPLPLTPKGNPFSPSLFVAASVVTANRSGRVIVNAGTKAFATDSGTPQPARGAPPGASYHFMGDEHGAMDFATGPSPAVGQTIELLTSHCDPTVNLFARYAVACGDEIIDEWPILARGY